MLPRAEISARVKAGRWLASRRKDAKGKPIVLSVQEMVRRKPLAGNMTVNRIHEIEQAKVDARPMELEKIADALKLPHEWFTADDLARLFRSRLRAPGLPASRAGLATKHLDPEQTDEPQTPSQTPAEADEGPSAP
jgi:hypothetical protein